MSTTPEASGPGYADQVRATVVAVYSGGEHRGSGFFCSPGVVVSCAHVVWRYPDEVEIAWNGARFAARVVVREPAEYGGGRSYAFPDLCLIRIEEPLDHPVAPFADTPELAERLSIHAMTRSLVSGEPAAHSAAVEVTGLVGEFIRVKGDEIKAGMSGAPAFDPRRGVVHGVVKASMDTDLPRGGVVIAAAHVQQALVRHRDRLRLPAVPGTALLRPDAGLRALLQAVQRAADRLPYGIFEDAAPSLSDVYVRLQSRARRGPRAQSLVAPEDMIAGHRHVLLTGMAGAGKTTLLAAIALETAAWWTAEDRAGPPPYGPVVALRLPARALAGTAGLADALAAAMNADAGEFLDRAVGPALFDERPVPGAEWLLLVDGLDEILDVERRHKVLDMLSHRLSEYGDRFRFLIASRPLPADEEAILRSRLGVHTDQRLGTYEVAPFDDAALVQFTRRWFAARSTGDAEARAERFLAAAAGPAAAVLETPLMATIAAIVYEAEPDSGLPVDRTGMYRRFVDYLLYVKGRQLGTRAALREQFGSHGRTAETAAEVLADEVERLLEELGRRRVLDNEPPSTDAALQWLRRRLGELPRVPDLPRQLRTLLSSTGVIHAAPGVLEFRHQSVAEYLAAGLLARTGFAPRRWVAGLRADGLTSLAAFTLARWVADGHDAEPVLRVLLRPGLLRRYPDLPLLLAVLRDGVRLGERGEPRLAGLVIAGLRHRLVIDDVDVSAFATALHELRQRTECDDLVLAIAADRGLSALKRTVAATALITDGPPEHAELADGLLREAAEHRWHPLQDRLYAMYALVRVDSPGHAAWAGRRLLAAAAGDDTTVAIRAMALLLELGLGDRLCVALLARVVDASTTIAARMDTLDRLAIVVDNLALQYAGIVASGYPLRHSHLPPFRDRSWFDTDEEAVHRMLADHQSGVGERIAAAVAVVWPMAADSVDALLRGLMLDPAYGWAARLHIAVDVCELGLDEAGRRALATLAEDSFVPAPARVVTANMLALRGDPDAASDLLAAWRDDPGDRLLRHCAVLASSPELVAAYVRDSRVPITFRLAAAGAGAAALRSVPLRWWQVPVVAVAVAARRTRRRGEGPPKALPAWRARVTRSYRWRR